MREETINLEDINVIQHESNWCLYRRELNNLDKTKFGQSINYINQETFSDLKIKCINLKIWKAA